MVGDRRQATEERITVLTGEIGTVVAKMMLPWRRKYATALAALLSELYAELGGRATSMAARAVIRPLEAMGTKLDEINARLDQIEARLARLDTLEARVGELEKRVGDGDQS